MSKQRKGGLLDGINLSNYTDARNVEPSVAPKGDLLKGINLSNYTDARESAIPSIGEEPSKKKVDTGLSGTTSSTVGVSKPIEVAVPKATEDDDSIFDSLANFAGSIKNSLSPAMRTLPINLLSGGVAFATNLVTGVIKGSIAKEDFKTDPYLQDIVDVIEKPSKNLMETAALINKAMQPQIDLAKRQAGIKEEYIDAPISEVMSQDVGQGFKKLGLGAITQIPQFVGIALTGGGNKARTFVAGATLGTTQAMQQEYEKDKDISGIDVAQSAMKGVIEGLTEMIFDTDVKTAAALGKTIVDVSMDGTKKAIKDMIESVGIKETRDVIVRNYKDVVKKGLLGMGEESLEEIIATGASFMVDAIDAGKLNVNDYRKLGYDLLDAAMLGASIGGPISVLGAVGSKRNLNDEQKASVSRFKEVANNKELSPEIRNIAKERIREVVDFDSDLVDEQYNKLAALPLDERIRAFSIIGQINQREGDSPKIKDVTLQEDNKKIIADWKSQLDEVFEANKPAVEVVQEPKAVTPEVAADLEKQRQEELVKAEASFRTTMGVPSEPMKVSSEFSIKTNVEDLGINNKNEPSPNMPLEVVRKEDAKKVQFTTKENPDALLEGDVYTVSQRGDKFATILSTSRNGVQEYYVPEMDNARPFSNLDDAKFAIQEKLTGKLIPEIQRSGIDRLRADKFMPKTDIVVTDDNGQDVLLDPVAKKGIQNAVKAFKTISPAPVFLYKNTEDFKKGVAKELGDNQDAIDTASKAGGGFFTNSKSEDSVHINLANMTETTVAHELFHGTLVNVARQNPSAFAEMRYAIINKLGESNLINVNDGSGKLINLSAKEYLDRYSKQYTPAEQAEEFLSELTGLLTTDKAKLKDATIWETIKLAIRNLVKTAGIDIPVFEKTANINDTVKFFNDLSKSFKTGQKIEFGKFKLTNEKQGATKGEAGKQSEAGKENESLQNAVEQVVEQRRKGNELGKKKRKLSAVAANAMAIEPTNPDDYALQYFINGGQVIRGSKTETKEKDTLFTLFSKARMGGSTEVVSEMRARVRIIGGRDAGGLSISEIAEKTFAEYQQATKGDVGIDVNTQYDYMDFKSAVENALLGNKSDTGMAVTLLESKNKSTQESATALTEDEQFEDLRIQAEAEAMGMTYDEFKSKLAEFEGNPAIGSIEDAYAQALDMIDDEDFANLYELDDSDIAKIDELMAGAESNDGTLDDKLAEQKKAVRDLEAERKKVISAMEKAGKETQLDITGKAPIQEQLFGADTKSLTDRLNAVDTQLNAAKADISATQSAIDFQEKGTVDMFEGETEVAPKAEEPSAQVVKSKQVELNSKLEELNTQLDAVNRNIRLLEGLDSKKEANAIAYQQERAKKIKSGITRINNELAKTEVKTTPAVKAEESPVQSKVAEETKAIQRDIDAYEREIENATEEIENTKSNYREAVAEIKEKKAALAKEKLSRDEREERKDELDGELEDAADKRDGYIEQYKNDIAEAKSDIKKLNKRLFKLQTEQPAKEKQKPSGPDINALQEQVYSIREDISLLNIESEEIGERRNNIYLKLRMHEDKTKVLDAKEVSRLNKVVKDLNKEQEPIRKKMSDMRKEMQKLDKQSGFKLNLYDAKFQKQGISVAPKSAEEANAQFLATRNGTPIGFNYDTDLVARERFNIPTLKKIGEGSDRVVFDLGDNKVLKVAKTARGLAQNIHEGSYDLVEEGILPEVFENGLNYIVAEKVESAKGNKAVNDLIRDLKNFTQRDFDMRTSKLQDVLEANDLSYVMNYDVLYGDLSSARNWGVKNGKPIHLDGGTFGGVQMINQYKGVKNLEDSDFRDVYNKSRQAKAKFGDKDTFTKFQKQGISVAPTYKYQMNEMFKDPQRLTKDIEAKYDIRTTLNERGKIEGTLIEVERALTDQVVTNALSKVGVGVFKTIGAIENAPLFKAGTGKTVKLKEALTGWAGYTGNKLRNATLKAIQSNNKYAATTGRVAASLIGNLAKSDVLQQQRALRSGSQLDANNSIAMLSKGLNGMIGFDDKALMRVHTLLDPEAYEILGGENLPTSPSDLSLQELRLYNTLRDMNDFIHEWHYQNEFIDQPTYDKHKGKYFARMYEEIERKEFADLHDAIDKMPSGVDFRMFKARKDFSEVELTLMNDPIYITSKRLATMLHNKATLEFCNAMAADPSYTTYKNAADIPENNVKGFKLLDSRGGGKRYGDLTNKYVPLALYEELRGTTFANKFVSASYDALRMYDGLAVRQFFKKTKTLYNPTTRLGNITTNFAFAWLAGVDPFTMMKNRVKAKDSLDNYDNFAKDLAIAGVLGTDVITADLSQKKDAAGVVGFLEKVGLNKELADKARAVDKYMIESYGRTDDVAKISLYRSLIEDYGKSKEEALRIVGESMQNYATVGKAYQYFSKMPLLGNPFVKFSSDMARIVANGFANRPLYMASFLGMMYGTARLLSGLSGEPEEEREARESRAFIPKIPLGFTDIPLTWKVGKYEVNAARFISPYYVYDAGYRSNTIAELTKFAPIQLSYENKVGFASDYLPVMSDPFIAPLAQVVLDKDFRGLPIADPNGSKYTAQTVTPGEALWNRANYLGHSYLSPIWGYTANLYSAATGQGDLYGRRRDIPSAILNSVIKVQEMESKDVQKAVINQVKYIDSEYKQIKTDITSRRNDDIEKIQGVVGSDATESQKENQILNIKASYSNFVEERVDRMQELNLDRRVPLNRLYKIQNPKKND
jgi:hypothetical protein